MKKILLIFLLCISFSSMSFSQSKKVLKSKIDSLQNENAKLIELNSKCISLCAEYIRVNDSLADENLKANNVNHSLNEKNNYLQQKLDFIDIEPTAKTASSKINNNSSQNKTTNSSSSYSNSSAKSYSTSSKSSGGSVSVKGYYRKDGTYVRPHTRRKR